MNRKRITQPPFDKVPEGLKKAKRKIGYTEAPSDPFKAPLDIINNLKLPKGFSGKNSYSGIGFGGFEDMSKIDKIKKKAKNNKKKFDKQDKPFDFFGGF